MSNEFEQIGERLAEELSVQCGDVDVTHADYREGIKAALDIITARAQLDIAASLEYYA